LFFAPDLSVSRKPVLSGPRACLSFAVSPPPSRGRPWACSCFLWACPASSFPSLQAARTRLRDFSSDGPAFSSQGQPGLHLGSRLPLPSRRKVVFRARRWRAETPWSPRHTKLRRWWSAPCGGHARCLTDKVVDKTTSFWEQREEPASNLQEKNIRKISLSSLVASRTTKHAVVAARRLSRTTKHTHTRATSTTPSTPCAATHARCSSRSFCSSASAFAWTRREAPGEGARVGRVLLRLGPRAGEVSGGEAEDAPVLRAAPRVVRRKRVLEVAVHRDKQVRARG
jgi:hypothetical protein